MNECNYHNGDEPLTYINNENCVFIDSAGIMDIYINNKHIRVECKYCPKCGERLR